MFATFVQVTAAMGLLLWDFLHFHAALFLFNSHKILLVKICCFPHIVFFLSNVFGSNFEGILLLVVYAGVQMGPYMVDNIDYQANSILRKFWGTLSPNLIEIYLLLLLQIFWIAKDVYGCLLAMSFKNTLVKFQQKILFWKVCSNLKCVSMVIRFGNLLGVSFKNKSKKEVDC